MKATLSLALCQVYERCPECKSTLIGYGEGTLMVDDTTFTRTCRCGFKVDITVKEQKNLYLKKVDKKK